MVHIVHFQKHWDIEAEFTLEAKKSEVKLQGVHIDYIEEAKSQKEIGDAGEEFVYQMERAKLKKYKLSKDKKVRMVSKLDGDGLGYDILSYDKHGIQYTLRSRLLQVRRTEAFLSQPTNWK